MPSSPTLGLGRLRGGVAGPEAGACRTEWSWRKGGSLADCLSRLTGSHGEFGALRRGCSLSQLFLRGNFSFLGMGVWDAAFFSGFRIMALGSLASLEQNTEYPVRRSSSYSFVLSHLDAMR